MTEKNFFQNKKMKISIFGLGLIFIFLILTFTSDSINLNSNSNKTNYVADSVNIKANINTLNTAFNPNTFSTKAIDITNNPVAQYIPSMTKDNSGRLWVAYTNETGASMSSYTNSSKIYAMYSTNNGQSFSKPVKISHSTYEDNSPNIIKDSKGNLWIFWDSLNTSSNYNIEYVNSTNNGQSWSQVYNMTNLTGEATSPRATVDASGNIFVFFTYQKNATSLEDAYYKELFVNGTWTIANQIPVSTTYSESVYSAWYGDNGDIYLFVEQYQPQGGIQVWVSSNDGVTWSVHSYLLNFNGGWGAIFEENGLVSILFTSHDYLQYTTTTDFTSWTTLASTSTQGYNPQFYVDTNGNLFVTFDSYASGNSEVYLVSFLQSSTSSITTTTNTASSQANSISSDISGTNSNPSSHSTPGFEVALVILGLAITAIIVRPKNKKI